MTAPLKQDTTIVDVALENRAYDIVIGRDVLTSLGARVAALRPGVRTAIVTDKTVAKHWLEKTEASLAAAGVRSSRVIVDECIEALHGRLCGNATQPASNTLSATP